MATINAASFNAPNSMCASGSTGTVFQPTGVHHLLQAMGDQGEAVLRVELPPPFPPEHGRRFEKDDASDRRVEAGIEEGQTAQSKRVGGIRSFHARGGDLLDNLLFELLDDSGEQFLFGREVVVERPSGDAGVLGDLIPTGRRDPRSAKSVRPATSRPARVADERSACVRRGIIGARAYGAPGAGAAPSFRTRSDPRS